MKYNAMRICVCIYAYITLWSLAHDPILFGIHLNRIEPTTGERISSAAPVLVRKEA